MDCLLAASCAVLGDVGVHPQLAGIAACCLVRELPLATLNLKDFADFVEYEGLELVS